MRKGVNRRRVRSNMTSHKGAHVGAIRGSHQGGRRSAATAKQSRGKYFATTEKSKKWNTTPNNNTDMYQDQIKKRP